MRRCLLQILSTYRLADSYGLSGGQDNSTDLALSRLEGFIQRLTALDPHDNYPEFNYAQEEVHKAEVDYNYCLYYPTDKEWRPPPSSDKRDLHKAKELTKPKQWRAALWRLIEKSMKDGTLEQVKDGTLVAAEIPPGIFNSVESTSPELNKQLDDKDKESNPEEASRSVGSSLHSPSRSLEQMMIHVSDRIVEGVVDDSESLRDHENPKTVPREDADQGSSLEEGELGDDAPKSEIDDAMMIYSNSAAVTKRASGPQQLDGPADLEQKRPTLKDLSPESLDRQLRYFHVGKLPEDVDLGLLAKCLACGGDGHDSESCNVLVCSSCKTYNKHLTVYCPTRSRCSKCRESGHNESSCPYKLKQISLDEVTCELCHVVGHVEEDCELMWRTSGRQWVPERYPNIRIQLSCYECGNQGHLGNDCPSRRPGKGFGSSSWSMFQIFDMPLRSEQHRSQVPSRLKRGPGSKKDADLKIKGRAQNLPSVHPPETLPDRNNFLHPKKLPESVHKGKIQINASTSQTLLEGPRPIPSGPIPRPIGDYGTTQHDHRLANDQAYIQDAGFARYNHGNPVYDGDYDRPRRRSRSPFQNARKRIHREDRHRPGPSPPLRGHRKEHLYRPMPSAAQNAYSRHRV